MVVSSGRFVNFVMTLLSTYQHIYRLNNINMSNFVIVYGRCLGGEAITV